MVIQVIINYIYLVIACTAFLSALTALIIATIYRKRCFNFPTLLACNTILGVVIFSADHIAICAYMLVWDQQEVPTVDSLCQIRSYLNHAGGAFIHHSFILQTIEKYFTIRRIHFFNTPFRKLLLVLPQWIVDLTFMLPILLTGNIVKPKIDNLCFISLSRPDLLFSVAIASFIITDITVITLYRLLVRYVRQVSSIVTGNQKQRMERDLTMVRRILMLNGLLVFLSTPVIAFNILNAIRGDLVPYYSLRFVLMILNFSMIILVIMICIQTPRLHQSFAACLKLVVGTIRPTQSRIRPATDITRF